jgi:hypothetical protein
MTDLANHSIDQIEKSLIDIAVESWRLSRLFSRLITKLDAGESNRYVNQLRYFQNRLEEHRCRANAARVCSTAKQQRRAH